MHRKALDQHEPSDRHGNTSSSSSSSSDSSNSDGDLSNECCTIDQKAYTAIMTNGYERSHYLDHDVFGLLAPMVTSYRKMNAQLGDDIAVQDSSSSSPPTVPPLSLLKKIRCANRDYHEVFHRIGPLWHKSNKIKQSLAHDMQRVHKQNL